jgi:hypothetical protein
MQEIERYLKGDVYVVRASGDTARRIVPNEFDAERVDLFELRDETWPTSIDLTEFRTRTMPLDFAGKASSVLRSLQSERPVLCWFMFDGAFDVAGIGSEWHRLNCYAVHAPSLAQPVLALTEAERRDSAWTQIWEGLAAQFYGEYPALRAAE